MSSIPSLSDPLLYLLLHFTLTYYILHITNLHSPTHPGTIFDVTHKREMYGPGKSYNIFAGKDGSKGLGMSSLKTQDAISDYSTLDEKDRKVLDDWFEFFS